MIRKLFCSMMLTMSIQIVIAQSVHVISGIVTDKTTSLPIQFANVVVLNSQPLYGAVTDSLGEFNLSVVPTGRYEIEVSLVGYQKKTIREVLVVSGKQTQLAIELEETVMQLDEVVVRPDLNKQKALNPFAMVSARMLSVEEASRYGRRI